MAEEVFEEIYKKTYDNLAKQYREEKTLNINIRVDLAEISDRLRELLEIAKRTGLSSNLAEIVDLANKVYGGLAELRAKTDKPGEFFEQYSLIKPYIDRFVALYKQLSNDQESVIKIKNVLKQLDLISSFKSAVDKAELQSFLNNLVSQFDIMWMNIKPRILPPS